MNYCVYLKKRKNKPFCKLLNKEIPFSCCQECDNKEYRTKNIRNSSYKSNKHQIIKKSTLKKKISLKSGKMKTKSNKLAKLERNRFSVFTNDKEKCMFCPSTTNLTWHEIFAGRNRRNSMEDGFCLRMCLCCHEKYQEDVEFNEFWHEKAQIYFEEHVGSSEEFLNRYRKNYKKQE